MKYLVFSLFYFGCINEFVAQELIFDGGIYCEKPRVSDTTNHKYTLDNISYKLNMVFVYDYYSLDKAGQKKKFILTDDETSVENPLNLTDYETTSMEAIDKIKMEVDDWSKTFIEFDTSYSQTVFTYSYLRKNGEMKDTICEYLKKRSTTKHKFPCGDESTGVIDNKKNLWMHPPRSYGFKILQLNPYPFYCLDESIKNWSWTLETGGAYLDPRWINYEGTLKIQFEYVRLKDEAVMTPFGKIYCKVTKGTGTADSGSLLMKTYLKSYYHPDYGFVKLEYDNINGTKIIMELVSVKK